MNPFNRLTAAWFTDESGASIVEYALLMALLVVVSLVAVTLMGLTFRDFFQTTSEMISDITADT